jgi:hypothetical protein
MNTQPIELRLADDLEKHVGGNIAYRSAAALRRLHEKNAALRQAIAEAEREATLQEISDIGREIEQEPVASIYISSSGEREFDDWNCALPIGRNELYAAPVKRELAELAELRLAYAECSKQRNELLNKLKSQPKREWVPLSDDDTEALIEDLAEWSRYVEVDTAPRSLTDHVRQVLAKLKEKNT